MTKLPAFLCKNKDRTWAKLLAGTYYIGIRVLLFALLSFAPALWTHRLFKSVDLSLGWWWYSFASGYLLLAGAGAVAVSLGEDFLKKRCCSEADKKKS